MPKAFAMHPAPPTDQTAADAEIAKTISEARFPKTPMRANSPLPKTTIPPPRSAKAADAALAPNCKECARRPAATLARDLKLLPATQSTQPAPPDEITTTSPQSPDETSP